MKRSTGFTLIELLVVIAIISLLVSILIPSLQKAKELAKGVVCSSNCKGISLAINYYTDMYNEILPNCDGGDYHCHWTFKLVQAGVLDACGEFYKGATHLFPGGAPFVGIAYVPVGQVTNVLHCPSSTKEEIGQDNYIVAYGSPQGVMGNVVGGCPLNTTLSMFKSLSRVVATYDAKDYPGNSPNYFGTFPVSEIWGGTYLGDKSYANLYYYLSTRHSDGANCLYLDGHVENNVIEDIYYQDMTPPRSWLPR